MLEGLHEQIEIKALIWLFLAAFMIHDFEEIIFVEGWMRKHESSLKEKIPGAFSRLLSRYGDVTSSRFAVPVAFEFIAFIPITFLAAEQQLYPFFLGINAVMFLHVFTHFGHSLYLRRYTPGVVTALLVALPYSSYMFYRLTGEGLIDWSDVWRSLPFGIILAPIVGLGYITARYILPVSHEVKG